MTDDNPGHLHAPIHRAHGHVEDFQPLKHGGIQNAHGHAFHAGDSILVIQHAHHHPLNVGPAQGQQHGGIVERRVDFQAHEALHVGVLGCAVFQFFQHEGIRAALAFLEGPIPVLGGGLIREGFGVGRLGERGVARGRKRRAVAWRGRRIGRGGFGHRRIRGLGHRARVDSDRIRGAGGQGLGLGRRIECRQEIQLPQGLEGRRSAIRRSGPFRLAPRGLAFAHARRRAIGNLRGGRGSQLPAPGVVAHQQSPIEVPEGIRAVIAPK